MKQQALTQNLQQVIQKIYLRLLMKGLLLLLSHLSRVRLCATPQTAAYQAPLSLDSPGKNTRVGCHFPLQCMRRRSVMSDSMRPHRWQPNRLPCPWDFPGKSTGVGCHCLLRMKELHYTINSQSKQKSLLLEEGAIEDFQSQRR